MKSLHPPLRNLQHVISSQRVGTRCLSFSGPFKTAWIDAHPGRGASPADDKALLAVVLYDAVPLHVRACVGERAYH